MASYIDINPTPTESRQPNSDKLKDLYEILKDNGAKVGTSGQFRDWMMKSEDNRRQVYEVFKDNGAKVGEQFSDFDTWLYDMSGQPTYNTQTGQSGVRQQPTQRKTRYDVAQEQYEQGRQQTSATPISQTAMGSVGGYGISPTGMPVRNTQGYPQANPQPQAPAKPMAPAPRAGQWSGAPTTQVPYAPTEEEGNKSFMPIEQGEDTRQAYAGRKQAKRDLWQQQSDNVNALLAASEKRDMEAGTKRTIFTDYGSEEVVTPKRSNETRELRAAQRALRNTQRIINAADNEAGFGQGLKERVFDIDNWDFGITDITDLNALKRAMDAFDKGEKLTESQRALLDAKALEMAVNVYFASDLSKGYQAGQDIAGSLPFMAEFMLGIGSAASKATSKALVKYFTKRFAKAMENKVVNTAVRGGARVLSDLERAAVMTGTTGAVGTEADARQRMMGQVRYNEDEQGKVTYAGHTQGEDEWKARRKAATARTLTNFSEMFGEYLGFLGKGGRWLSGTKGGKFFGLDKVAGFIDNVASSEIGSFIGRIESKAQFHGAVGEMAEELFDGVTNATFVGDQTLQDVFGKENLTRTALSVGIMSMFFSGAKLGGYGVAKGFNAADMAVRTRRADRAASNAFGTQWDGVKGQLDGATAEQAADIIQGMFESGEYTDEQLQSALNYAIFKKGNEMIERYKANNQTMQEAAAEQSYNMGYDDANTDELRSDINMAYTDARAKLVGLIGEDAVNDIDSDPLAMQAQYDQDMTVDDNTKYAIADYVSAKSAWDGVQQRISDDAADRADQRRAEGERMAYKGKGDMHGMVRPLTINEDSSERDPETGERIKKTVYLVNGTIAIEPNGNGLSREGTDKTIYVYDPETGEAHELDPFGGAGVLSVGDVVSMEDYLADNEQQSQAEVQQEIDNATGKVNVQPNTPFVTPEGRQGIVKSVEGDNVIVQFADGEMEEASIPLADMQQYADALRRQEYEARHPQQTAAEQPQQPNTATEGQAPTAEAETPTEGEQATEDTRTPAQRTYDDMQSKYGEKASHKVDVTLKDRKSTLDTKKKALDKAQADYDDAPIGKEDKAEAALAKAQAEYDTALADYNAWDEVRKLRDQALLAQSEAEDAARKAERERRLAEETEAQRKQREEYEAEQARRKAEAEAAEKRRQEENERLRQQAANPQPAEEPAPIEGTKGQASQLEIARQDLADDPEALAMLDETAPRTLVEVAATLLASGKNATKLLREDFKRETGYSDADVKRYPFLFAGADKGGITLARFGEMVVEAAREYGVQFDENDATAGIGAALELLSSVGRQSDINNYVAMNRIRMAYDYHNTALAAARARMLEAYGMTEGEYEAYMSWLEDAIEQGKSTLSDEEFNQLFNIYEQGQTTDVARGNQESTATTERTESAETDVSQNGERGNGEADAGAEQAAVSQYEEAESAFFGFLEWTNWEYGTNYDWNSLTSFLKWANKKAKAKDQLLRKFVREWIGDKYPPKDAAALTDKIFAALKAREEAKKAETAQAAENTAYAPTEEEYAEIKAYLDEHPNASRAELQRALRLGYNKAVLGMQRWGSERAAQGATAQDTAQAIAAAEAETDTKPTEGQKEAGNYKKGHVRIDGYDITIEQPKGSVRRGTDKNGRAWEQEMHNTYGYIRGTESVDGDHIDIFLSDDPTQGNVYVVDQVDPETGEFDEHKVMYGFPDMESARQAYLSNYEDGWRGLGTITPVSKEEFKKWIESSHRKTKPFSEYKGVKNEGGSEKTEKYRNGESIKDYTQRNGDYPTTREQYMKQKYGERYSDMANIMSGINAENAREKGRQIGALLETDGNGLDEAQALLSVFKADASSTMPFFDGVVEGKPKENGKVADGLIEEMAAVDERERSLAGKPGYNEAYNAKAALADRIAEVAGDLPTKDLQRIHKEAKKRGMHSIMAHVESELLKRRDAGKKQRADGKAAKVSAKERKLRDAVVDLLRKAGIDVVTESEEGQRVLDMANGRERQHRVYHGSGADFERFDHSHMGEGEGAQAFGWGTYVTEVEGIGRTYAENLPKVWFRDTESGYEVDWEEVRDNWEEGAKRSALLRVFENARGTDYNMEDAIENAISEIEGREGYEEELAFLRQLTADNFEIDRILYTVEIPEDNGSNYIDWTKKPGIRAIRRLVKQMNDRQKERIANIPVQRYTNGEEIFSKDDIERRILWHIYNSGWNNLYDVAEIANGGKYVGNEKSIAKLLNAAGFVGIKYPAEYYSGGRSDGAKNYVIFNESDLQITDKVKFFRTESGEAYGFTLNGKIYLDPKIATAETPIHEYTHLWAAALRAANPKAWERLKSELEKDKDLMAYVQRLYPELKGDELMDEVFAHFSGRRGAERMRAEQERMEGETRSIVGKAKVIAMFENLRNALKKFWNAARELFAGKGVKNESAEDFADMVLADLVNGVKPDRGDRLDRSDIERDAEYLEAVESGDMEKAQRMVNEAAKRAMPDTKVVDENGNPLVVYHGTQLRNPKTGGAFYEFHNNSHFGTIEQAEERIFYPLMHNEYTKTYSVFLNIKNLKRVNDIPKGSEINHSEYWDKEISKAKEEGYDGLIYTNVWEGKTYDEKGKEIYNDSYISFYPSQIKSADPVTYDDNGNVIPLSQRFNKRNADIRYQRGATDSDVRFRGEDEPVFYSNAMRAVENIKQERATPEQWVKMIEKQGGLKAGEDKWLGLSEWLKGSDAKTLTKGEVLDYIRANEIQVEEVEYGNSLFTPTIKASLEREIANGKEEGKTVEEVLQEWDEMASDMKPKVTMMDAYKNGVFNVDDEGRITNVPVLNSINSTRLSYTTEGLDNKREIVLTVPTIEPWNEHDEVHFGEAGGGRAVAWVRFGETTDADGKRVLVIDEIQSKRHQEGREKGYKSGDEKAEQELNEALRKQIEYTDAMKEKYGEDWVANATEEEIDKFNQLNREATDWALVARKKGVPDAPFDKNWHEVAMKRMLRFAAENGYDKVAWTKGEQQARRYDLGQVIDKIVFKKETGAPFGEPDRIFYPMKCYKDGELVKEFSPAEEHLEELVGRDIANEMKASGFDGENTIEKDLITGNVSGMQGFYDQILPRFMDKYGKKWGVKTGEVTLPNVEEAGRTMWSVDVTDDMRESVMRGQPLFRPKTQSREGGEEAAQGEWYDRNSVERIGEFAGYTPKQIAKMNARQEQSARKQFNDAAEKLHLSDTITFADSIDDVQGLTDKQRREWRRKKGWYSPLTGKIVIILGNHKSMDDVMKSILHEGVAHHGLRQMFGEHFNTFLDNVYRVASPEIRERIYAMAKKHGWDFRTATEEYLATLAEDTEFEKPENQSWWKQVKAWFIDLLHKIGFNLHDAYDTITDNELRYILWRSYENLVNPGRYNSVVEEAKDIAKQYDLKVGQWDETWTVAAEEEPNATMEFNGRRVPIWATNGRRENRADRVERNDRTGSDYNVAADGVAEDGIRFRDGEDEETGAPKPQARGAYERMVSSAASQWKEAMQDSMLSLKKLYQAVSQAYKGSTKGVYRIEDEKGYENAYLAENRMHSMSEAQIHAYQQDYMKPLQRAIHALTGGKREAYETLTDYMMAKHGLERNEVMAKREAKKAWEEQNKSEIGNPNYTAAKNAAFANIDAGVDDLYLEYRKQDYAGLTALTGIEDVEEAEKEAQRMVDEYEQQHDTTDLWIATNRATRRSLFKMLESGLLSPQRHAEIRDMYQYYIPLQGFDSDVAEDVYAYMGSDGTRLYGTTIRAAKGRKSKADDPIATIAMNGEAAIRRGNRNLMKQHFLRFVQSHPSDLVSINDVWLRKNANGEWEQYFDADLKETDTPEEVARKVRDFNERMEQEAAANPDLYKRSRELPNVPFRVLNVRDMEQHQVMVQVDGKNYLLTINGNPRAAQALNGLTNPDVFTEGAFGSIMNATQSVVRTLSQFYTTRNPNFVLSNFLRDAVYTNSMVLAKESPNYALAFHKNFLLLPNERMGVLFASWENGKLREKLANGTASNMEKMFYDFMMNGGETGWTSLRDIEKHKRDLQKALKREGNIAASALNKLGDFFDITNRMIENHARFTAYVTSIEMGRSVERAVWDAKEISVNFNKKGAGDKFLKAKNQTFVGKVGAFVSGLGRGNYAFWNASLQGLNNIARIGKRNPAKFMAVATTLMGLGVAIPLLNALLGGDDDDDKNAYWNLPEYVRRSNICFRFTKDMPWITIPLPIEFRAVYGLGELGSGVALGKEYYSNSDLTKQVAAQFSQVLPLDFMEGGGGWHCLYPTYIKPVIEAYSNQSWTGLPIYRKNTYGQYDVAPEWQRAYSNTNNQIMAATKWLNEATGGDEVQGGNIDFNPARIEYMLRGYLGGYFTVADQVIKMGETATGNREFEWRNMMLANRVVKEGDERTEARKLTNEYFNLKEEYDKTDKSLKAYKKKQDEGTLSVVGQAHYIALMNDSEEYGRYLVFGTYKPLFDAYYKQIKEANAAGDSEEAKRLERGQNELRREMVNIIHDMDNGGTFDRKKVATGINENLKKMQNDKLWAAQDKAIDKSIEANKALSPTDNVEE